MMSKEFSQRLIESAPDGILLVDSNGQISLANPQAELLFGYSKEELIGQPVEILVPMRSRPQHTSWRTQYSSCPRRRPMGANMDLTGRRKDGSEFPVEISLSPVESRDGVFITTFIRDISERRKAQRSLQRAHAELEQKNIELTALNRELEAFSYSVSHDLRAPLRGMDGFSLALLEDYGSRLDETAKTYLNYIRKSTQHMGQIIDDLLKLSRVTRADLRLEEVDLSALATSLLNEMKEKHPNRSAQVSVADGIVAHADYGLVKLALENLLSNAWKFTSRRQETEIELGQNEQGLYVRDNGAGFEMKYAHKLFGAFQRLHSPQEFQGTGIGLAIVKRVVERHGGKIWVRSEENVGTTFYFTLGRSMGDEHGKSDLTGRGQSSGRVIDDSRAEETQCSQ